MKKCASCSKDLPEAALHCVFCGAKQPPAPAVQPGLAKTAFGYSAAEAMKQQQPPRPPPGSQPPPYAQPTQPAYMQPTLAQAPNAANAATMFAPPSAPPQYQQPPVTAPGMGIQAPRHMPPTPLHPVAPVMSPYLSSPTARAGHPIEPWKDSLRVVMLVWGVLVIAAFVTPFRTNPLGFNWEAILHGEGTQKLPPLIMVAVGALSILLSAIPMVPLPRGLLAAVLGLAGIFAPMAISGAPVWQELVALIGTIVLVPALLLRNEYVDSFFARVAVTVGVVAMLLPFLLPNHGEIPLIGVFKGLLDAPGGKKLEIAVELGMIVLAVLCLLAWLPGPATAGAKVLAWLIILWPTAVRQLVHLVVKGNIGDAVSASPFVALAYWVPAAAYFALGGYGLATVAGKQLE